MKRLLVFLSAVLISSSNLWAQLNVYFVDVGQGDAIYIEFPSGRNALIDGGPSGALMDSFLKSKGVTKIDYVALTHPHSDHYRGLKKVFTNYQINHYYDTKAENVDAAGDNNLRDLAAVEPGCTTHYPKPGDILNWDTKVTVKVFNACWEPVLMHDNDETNNCSLVIRLYYNGNGILLTGDANSGIESEMLRYFKSGLQSNILKVGHHGSRTSTSDAFLARVRPKYAVISYGVGNVYKHPHIEAIDRLKAVGAQLYYTSNGTQWLTIPAMKNGQTSTPEPIFNGSASTNTEHQPYRDIMLSVDQVITPENVSSEALLQLKDNVPVR